MPGSANRAALAERLTELRKAAGLSGNALAKRMDVVQSRVWKIEHGEVSPTEGDIQAWVQATVGDEQTVAELLKMRSGARTERQFGAAFRKKGGAAEYQDQVRAIEDESARIGEFQVAVIPGILQTADYARDLLSVSSGPRAWGADDSGVEAMIDSRLRRQEVLYGQSKRIEVVLSEAALRVHVASSKALAGQLGKLLSVMRLPAVELGVIGFPQRMPAYSIGGFRVYDDRLIIVESIAGERYFMADTEPDEVATFLGAFDMLRQVAATGNEAEALIQQALQHLGEDV